MKFVNNHEMTYASKKFSANCPQHDGFTYLGSVVDNRGGGGTEADVKARIGIARATFLQLKKIWSSTELTLQTKILIFESNVRPVLLYESET